MALIKRFVYADISIQTRAVFMLLADDDEIEMEMDK